jgi:DUF4097 and DUF4098 domain-containing protein YvlB
MKPSPFSLAYAAGVLCFALPAGAAATGHFERTLHVNGPVDLEVQTGSGDITVRPGSGTAVEIRARIYASSWIWGGDLENEIRQIEQHPPIEQNGNSIRIGRFVGMSLHNISISYELAVPAQTRLRSSSGSGDQRISGIQGPVDASSGSGTITIADLGGDSRVRAGSGDIELRSIRGRIQASAGSGSIRGTLISGPVSAQTGSGDIRVRELGTGDISVSTGSGSIEIKGARGSVRAGSGSGDIVAEGEPAADWRLHTSSGDLRVSFPVSAAFDLDARTSSGSIDAGSEIAFNGVTNSHELRGKVRGGGSLIELSTSSGSIRID